MSVDHTIGVLPKDDYPGDYNNNTLKVKSRLDSVVYTAHGFRLKGPGAEHMEEALIHIAHVVHIIEHWGSTTTVNR